VKKKKKNLLIGALVATLIGGSLIAHPAKAASTDLVIGSVLDIDKTDPHTATNFATASRLGTKTLPPIWPHFFTEAN